MATRERFKYSASFKCSARSPLPAGSVADICGVIPYFEHLLGLIARDGVHAELFIAASVLLSPNGGQLGNRIPTAEGMPS